MGFCTKCGRKLEDGEVCNCQNAANNTSGDAFDPYASQQSNSSSVSVDDKDVVINVDTDKMKKGISDAVGKFATGIEMISEQKDKYYSSSAFENGMKIVPDCITANDGEVPIKQYDFAQLRNRLTFEKAQGRIQVTNKRIIFRAAGRSLFGRSVLHQEFRIDELAGVEIRTKHEFNLLSMIFGIIITAFFGGLIGFALSFLLCGKYEMGDLAIPPSFVSCVFGLFVLLGCCVLTFLSNSNRIFENYYGLRQILLSIAAGSMLAVALTGDDSGFMWFCFAFLSLSCLVNLFLYSIVPNLVAVFKTGASAAIEIRREPIMGLLSFLFTAKDDLNSGYQEILPWKDTDLAIKELGTMIDDIKTMGDAAIKKWKVD